MLDYILHLIAAIIFELGLKQSKMWIRGLCMAIAANIA